MAPDPLARRAGIIPESWVEDARAPEAAECASFDDADDFAQTVVEALRSGGG